MGPPRWAYGWCLFVAMNLPRQSCAEYSTLSPVHLAFSTALRLKSKALVANLALKSTRTLSSLALGQLRKLVLFLHGEHGNFNSS